MNQYLLIGSVLKPQGVRGECKIRSYAADAGRFRKWTEVFLKTEGGYRSVSLETVRVQDEYVYAHLDGSASVEDAEAFRGSDLYIDRSLASRPGKDACLIADLIGCTAADENGVPVGVLTDVLQYGPVDTWVFRTENPKGTLMAPALKAVFPSVDPEMGTIAVCREKLEEVAVRGSIS